jgi:hypothetical protein
MSRYRHEKERTAFITRFLPPVTGAQLKEEKRMFAELFEKYPDLDFWRGFNPHFEINSLTYFFGPAGKRYIKKAFLIFSFEGIERPVKPVLQSEKVGEDRVVKTKPRTVRDFLNG